MCHKSVDGKPFSQTAFALKLSCTALQLWQRATIPSPSVTPGPTRRTRRSPAGWTRRVRGCGGVWWCVTHGCSAASRPHAVLPAGVLVFLLHRFEHERRVCRLLGGGEAAVLVEVDVAHGAQHGGQPAPRGVPVLRGCRREHTTTSRV